MPQPPPDGPVLLYDGTCGFCAESVQYVLKHDRKRSLRFAALDSAFGGGVLRRHPELAEVDSVLWVQPANRASPSERVYARSAAALEVLRYLGGIWWLAAVVRVIPTTVRDAAYLFIARHRHHLTRGGQQCFVPTEEERARFLQ